MKKLFILLPVFSGILWGSVGIFVRYLSAGNLNNPTILFARNGFGVLLLLIAVLVMDRSLLRVKKKDLWIFITGGIVGMAGINFCYNEALSSLSLSLAAVLLL